MNTYLGKKIVKKTLTNKDITLQEVVNIDDAIGKSIRTKEDFTVTADNNKNGLEQINIKEMVIKIEDVIRTCGLYLFCRTEDNFTFALRPDELERFEDIS